MEGIDIDVIQKPIRIEFTCPHCDEENSINYDEFISKFGDVCEWTYSTIKCSECGESLGIDQVNWE